MMATPIYKCARWRLGEDSGRTVGSRGRTADVCGCHDFQSPAQQRRTAGDLVAILGIGGLGHLGIQFAAKMGFNVVAIARGMDKEPLARKLGASHYIESKTQDPGAITETGPR